MMKAFPASEGIIQIMIQVDFITHTARTDGSVFEKKQTTAKKRLQLEPVVNI